MQTNHTRAAGAISALIAAGGVVYALRPGTQLAAAQADRNPAIEVRTVVIRHTIHIVRHERVRPPVVRAPATAGAARPPAGAQISATAGATLHTSSSHHASAGTVSPPVSGTAPLTTATSKHATSTTSSTPTATGQPPRTKTSSHSTGSGTQGTSAPVTTRTSAGHSGGSGKAGTLTTRTSHGGDDDGGGDGGSDGGHDD